jgi:hypothetical protein
MAIAEACGFYGTPAEEITLFVVDFAFAEMPH